MWGIQSSTVKVNLVAFHLGLSKPLQATLDPEFQEVAHLYIVC